MTNMIPRGCFEGLCCRLLVPVGSVLDAGRRDVTVGFGRVQHCHSCAQRYQEKCNGDQRGTAERGRCPLHFR